MRHWALHKVRKQETGNETLDPLGTVFFSLSEETHKLGLSREALYVLGFNVLPCHGAKINFNCDQTHGTFKQQASRLTLTELLLQPLKWFFFHDAPAA